MKNFVFILLFIGLTFPLSASASHVSYTQPLAERVKGHILLQTDAHGEAWYVDPVNGGRYYMKDGPTAYAMMRHFGLGVSEADFQLLSLRDKEIHDRLKGRVVLRVGYHGEAWYIHPDASRNLYYLQDGPAAYDMMRYLSMGITDADLAQIEEKILSEPVLPEYSREGEDQGIQYTPPFVRLTPIGWVTGTDRTPVPVAVSMTNWTAGKSSQSIGYNSTFNRSLAKLSPNPGTTGALTLDLSTESRISLALDVENTNPNSGFYCYSFGNEFWYQSIDPIDQTIELDLHDEFAHYFDVHFNGQADAKKTFQFRVHCANAYGTTYQDWVDLTVQR